jgi:hypothetical protein
MPSSRLKRKQKGIKRAARPPAPRKPEAAAPPVASKPRRTFSGLVGGAPTSDKLASKAEKKE